MVNVTAFERAFVKLYTQWATHSNWDMSELLRIPDSRRPVLFRGLDDIGITHVLLHLNDAIREVVPSRNSPTPLIFESSDNNRLHSDLREVTTDTHVELKLGSSTDVNAGFGPILRHLLHGDPAMFPTRQDRTRWRTMYRAGLVEDIRAQQDELLTSTAQYLSEHISGTTVPESGQKLLNGYWLGITNVNEIMSPAAEARRRIYRFSLADDYTWRNMTREAMEHTWVHMYFTYTEARRFNFGIENDTGHDLLRMTLNYKNSYRYPDGTRVDASVGLGSPSFNGWWTTVVR